MKSNQNDLRHFVELASSQIRHRIKLAQTAEEKAQISHLRLLETLLKEQVPANVSKLPAGNN
jgi:hypothetical protein